LTGGNHVWDKKEGIPLVRAGERILRPANYPPGVDGRGWGVFRGRSGTPYAVVSLIGRVFMGSYDCPFRWADAALPGIRERRPAWWSISRGGDLREAALALYLDGTVSAIAGTHTHVQTSDASVLPGGTGYITDAGCAAPPGRSSGWIRRRSCGASSPGAVRFDVAAGEPEASGVFFDLDPGTGRSKAVQAFRISESQMRSKETWKRSPVPEAGTVEVISGRSFRKVAASAREKRPLRVKAGFDPTAPDLTSGTRCSSRSSSTSRRPGTR